MEKVRRTEESILVSLDSKQQYEMCKELSFESRDIPRRVKSLRGLCHIIHPKSKCIQQLT